MRSIAALLAQTIITSSCSTGLQKFPFKAFALNEVWLEIVMLAHDLLVWTQALLLTGELAKAEPKRIRYRLLHVGR